MTDKDKCAPGGCECGCDCGNDDEPEIMTLEFDDGNEVECEVMGVFDVDGKEYIALFATDGSDEVYLYGYKELDDAENDCELIDIENDEEYERVCAVFEELTAYEDDEEDEE